MSLLETHPPVQTMTGPDGKEIYQPILPIVFTKNARYFLRADMARAVKIFVSTIVPTKSPAIPSFSVRPLFNKKQKYWTTKPTEECKEHIEALAPLFDALEFSSRTSGSGIRYCTALQEILAVRPVSPILYFLVNEAFLVLDSILAEHEKHMELARKDKDAERVTQELRGKTIQNISRIMAYIFTILDHLCERLTATSKLENKRDAQSDFENDFQKLLDKIEQYSQKCFGKGSSVVDPQSHVSAQIDNLVSYFILPSLKFTSNHPHLSLHTFQKYKHILGSFDQIKKVVEPGATIGGLSNDDRKLYNSLQNFCEKSFQGVRPRIVKVNNIPNYRFEPPYWGIPSWNSGPIFESIIAKIPPKENINFWINVASCLTSDQKSAVKNCISQDILSHYIQNLNSSMVRNIFTQFFSDIKEIHERAIPLLSLIKNLDISYSVREQLEFSIEFLSDVRIPEVREKFQLSLNAPSIELRVAAIKRFLQVTERQRSVTETFKTISWLFNRVK